MNAHSRPFERVTILGDGGMATACALILDANGRRVRLWSPTSEHALTLERDGENRRYLPGIPLPGSLSFTGELSSAAADADLIVSAIPTQYKRSVWQRFAEFAPPGVPVVSVAKGIEAGTGKRPTEVITETLGGTPGRSLAVLSGPSIAGELARCLPATVCAAGDDEPFTLDLQSAFTTSWFRVYTNRDVLGVELAGALKNVIALAAGILDGLNAGYNAKSALLSRGLAEITRLGTALGAQRDTFFGITGVGDLATTCFCPEGRNRSAGELLGKGLALERVLDQMPGVVEGVPTTKAVAALATEKGIDMPITQGLHAVLFEGLDPLRGISQLMSRAPKAERIG